MREAPGYLVVRIDAQQIVAHIERVKVVAQQGWRCVRAEHQITDSHSAIFWFLNSK